MADPSVQPLVLVMLDLDGFHDYNREHGHPAGDALLQAAARAITASVRDGDLCFRYGGDEFALLLPGTDEDSATLIAERVRLAIAAANTRGAPAVTASVGLGISPRDAQAPAPWSPATDAALFRAKESGGNRVQVEPDQCRSRPVRSRLGRAAEYCARTVQRWSEEASWRYICGVRSGSRGRCQNAGVRLLRRFPVSGRTRNRTLQAARRGACARRRCGRAAPWAALLSGGAFSAARWRCSGP